MLERKFSISEALYCFIRFTCWNISYSICLGVPLILLAFLLAVSTNSAVFQVAIAITSYGSYFLSLKKTLLYQYKSFTFKKQFEKVSHKDALVSFAIYIVVFLALIIIIRLENTAQSASVLSILLKILVVSLIANLISIWLFIRMKTTVVIV